MKDKKTEINIKDLQVTLNEDQVLKYSKGYIFNLLSYN